MKGKIHKNFHCAIIFVIKTNNTNGQELDSSVLGYGMVDSDIEVRIRPMVEFFLFSTMSRLTLGPAKYKAKETRKSI
jgi:hypothetical protein